MPERTRILDRMIDQLLRVQQLALKLPPEFRSIHKSLCNLSEEVKKARIALSVYPREKIDREEPVARG
jgi:hypothetical protein